MSGHAWFDCPAVWVAPECGRDVGPAKEQQAHFVEGESSAVGRSWLGR
jgi:hypothetical protein